MSAIPQDGRNRKRMRDTSNIITTTQYLVACRLSTMFFTHQLGVPSTGRRQTLSVHLSLLLRLLLHPKLWIAPISLTGWSTIFEGCPGRPTPLPNNFLVLFPKRTYSRVALRCCVGSRNEMIGCWCPGPKGRENLPSKAWASWGLKPFKTIFGGELGLWGEDGPGECWLGDSRY